MRKKSALFTGTEIKTCNLHARRLYMQKSID